MNEYINMLKEIAEEANRLAENLGNEEQPRQPINLSAQELHNLRVRLSDLNRRNHAPRHNLP